MFEIVGDITKVQVIATGRGIRRLKTLRKRHGGKRWRKLKGDATVRLANGSLRRAEIHWYEAHGVGKRGLKIKRFLDWHHESSSVCGIVRVMCGQRRHGGP